MYRIALMAAVLSLATATHAAEGALRSELERIYFGHQSVGANLLDGLRELAGREGVPLRIVEAPTASAVGPATFGHSFVAENRDPLKKLESFRAALDSGAVDIALLEFCYVDINGD